MSAGSGGSDAAGGAAGTGGAAGMSGVAGGAAGSAGGAAGAAGSAGGTSDGGTGACPKPSKGFAMGTISAMVDGMPLSGNGLMVYDGKAGPVFSGGDLANGFGFMVNVCAPGTYSLNGATGTVAMSMSVNMGTSTWSCGSGVKDGTGQSCTVKIDEFGSAVGGPVKGTFSGTLPLQSGMGVPTRMLTGGMFDFKIP